MIQSLKGPAHFFLGALANFGHKYLGMAKIAANIYRGDTHHADTRVPYFLLDQAGQFGAQEIPHPLGTTIIPGHILPAAFLEAASNLPRIVNLYLVSGADVVVVLNTDTTFETTANLVHVVFKAT